MLFLLGYTSGVLLSMAFPWWEDWDAVAYAYQNQDVIFAVSAIVTVAFVASAFTLFRKRGPRVKQPKIPDESAKLIEDIILEGLDTLFLLGKMSAKRKRYWMTRLGTEMGLLGLLPVHKRYRKLSAQRILWLKNQIKGRLGLGLNRPVKLPGETKTATKAKVRGRPIFKAAA